MTRVAMVGLGRMGGPMARNVLEAGHEVAVFDVSEAALAAFSDSEARIATSPADASNSVEVVCVVVLDDAQTIDVVTGSHGVLETLTPGSVVAVHSTISPETLRTIAQAGDAAGVHVIDAGISGGEPGAAAGTLLTMVGGSHEAVERATSVLDAFSKEIVHAGGLGAGLALKLARNATGYIWMTAIHEAMQIAVSSGVDLNVLHHTISETGVFDQALSPFRLDGPEPLPDDAPEPMRQVLTHLRTLGEKDLDQMLALAAELDVDLPVTAATRRCFHSVARL